MINSSIHTVELYKRVCYSDQLALIRTIHKLREISDDENCKFVLWNGKKRLIKRKKLEEYLDNCYSI